MTTTVPKTIRPGMVSAMCSVAFYIALILRCQLFKVGTFAEGLISAVRAFLNCWVIASLMTMIVPTETVSSLTLSGFLKNNQSTLLLIGIVFSWLGMGISQDIFRWGDYFEARSTAEKAFRIFYQQQNYPSAGEDNATGNFIVSFFNEKIDECIFAWEDQHPGQEYSQPSSTEDDIDVVYLARVFSCAEMHGKGDDRIFCESIGVNYDFEQLHMCCWFSSQITNGDGQYSRADANTSARTTYNHLRNPRSLLWIALIMGVDRNTLSAAVEEMRDKKTDAAKCSVVRKHVPFCSIYALFQDMIIGQEKT